ncbi:hypothetical protein CV016_00725 [Yersinia kristensenii]|uniref:HNH endonuclease n=1 Tax=Yersinia kristensenii TaxID=28152 RepID=UPI000C2238FD|nr:HNH endonuclease [Yersinia kristensenii]PJG64583.1 hypothetical protein CV016_00725 [Yersinia kristensenii]
MKNWVVYVAGAKAKANYELGKQHGIWGVKNVSSKSCFKDIKRGDTVFFVHEVKWPHNAGKLPGGYPKFLKNQSDFKGIASEFLKCKVTQDYYYEDIVSVWEDSKYPHRFNFELVEKTSDVLFFKENYSEELLFAALRSIKTSGDAIPLPSNFILQDTLDEDMEIYENSESDASEHSASEGKRYIYTHTKIERDQSIVKKKKELFIKKHKRLFCEACGFDFDKVYGAKHSKSFIECHHVKPLALSGETETNLSHLVLLCSNCHSIVHRSSKSILPLDELRALLK